MALVPAAAVRQIQIRSLRGDFSVGAGGWLEMPGFRLSIQYPKQSAINPILVVASIAFSTDNNTASRTTHFRLIKVVGSGILTEEPLDPSTTAEGSRVLSQVSFNQDSDGHRAFGQSMWRVNILGLDNDATDSGAVIYGVQVYQTAGLAYINRSAVDTNSDLYARGSSVIAGFELDNNATRPGTLLPPPV